MADKKKSSVRGDIETALEYAAPVAGAYVGARVMGKGLKKAWKKTGDALSKKDARWNSLTEKQKENVRNFKKSGDPEYDAFSAAERAADKQVTRRYVRGNAGAFAGGAAGIAATGGFDSSKRRK